MSAALDPNVTHLLAYAVIAVLVILSFVGGVLLILGKVKRWLRDLFSDWARSEAFGEAVERILTQVAERFRTGIEPRLARLEAADAARAAGVTRAHERSNEHDKELHDLKDELLGLQRMLMDRLLDRLEGTR